jgi:hypothetical protein
VYVASAAVAVISNAESPAEVTSASRFTGRGALLAEYLRALPDAQALHS